MDRILEASKDLGRLIQQDERFVRYHLASQARDEDEGLQQEIASFNDLRTKLNHEVQKEAKDSRQITELDKEIKKAYTAITEHPIMITLTDAQNVMNELITSINKLVQGAANGENPEEIDLAGCSSSDCAGCSGC